MGRLNLTEEDINEIIRLYTEENKSTITIGEMYNTSKVTINKLLKKHNVELHKSGRRYLGGVKVSSKKYHSKPEIKKRKKEIYYKWLEENLEHRTKYMKDYREKNVDRIRETKRIYEKTRKDSDPFYKLCCYTRTAVYTCLKERNVAKYSNTFDFLPFTLNELISHLENKFTDGMTWDNYGEWHVDHIIPMSSFSISYITDDSFKECWSLNNLQPLWGVENLSKGSSLPIQN